MIGPAILAAVLPALRDVFDRAFPDPIERAKVESQATLAILDAETRMRDAAASVLVAEIKGESWLQRSWRPIIMLTFAALIAARWFGIAAPGLSEAEYLKLWGIVEFGLGGYVLGRSAEKIAGEIAPALKRGPSSALEAWRAR